MSYILVVAKIYRPIFLYFIEIWRKHTNTIHTDAPRSASPGAGRGAVDRTPTATAEPQECAV